MSAAHWELVIYFTFYITEIFLNRIKRNRIVFARFGSVWTGPYFQIGHSDRRHLEILVLLIFLRSETGNYRTTGTLPNTLHFPLWCICGFDTNISRGCIVLSAHTPSEASLSLSPSPSLFLSLSRFRSMKIVWNTPIQNASENISFCGARLILFIYFFSFWGGVPQKWKYWHEYN